MSKINDNTYINKLKKEIMDNRFSTKEDLIDFLLKNRTMVLTDSFFRQELEDSFIKLNNESLQLIEKEILNFYDKRKNLENDSVNLEGVSSFEIDGKDYIKIENDGDFIVLDDTVNNNNFVEQFHEKQNELQSASTLDAETNKKAIIEDMQKEKTEANLSSSLDINTRELTPEESAQFAAVMNMPYSDNINFVVDTQRNMYINKDTGEVYFVNKNQYGVLEVHKANEAKSEIKEEKVDVIDDSQENVIANKKTSNKRSLDSISDSDLEYVYENKSHLLTEEQRNKLKLLIEKRKAMRQQSLENTKSNEKVFVKKINNALNKEYNGFISIMFLCSVVAFFSMSFLMLIAAKIK